MSCISGINFAINKILNNKPWFKYKEGDKFIEILDSPNKNINRTNAIKVAGTVANTINKQLNNNYPNIGNIVYPDFYNSKVIVDIKPSSNQIDYINSEDEKEKQQLLEEIKLENSSDEKKTEVFEDNVSLNEEGDVVIKKNALLRNFQENNYKDFEGDNSFNNTFEVEKEIQNEYATRLFGSIRGEISENQRIQFSEELSSLDSKKSWEIFKGSSSEDNLSFGELLRRIDGENASLQSIESKTFSLSMAMFIASRIQNKSDRFLGRLFDSIRTTREQKGRTGGNIVIYYDKNNEAAFSAYKGNIEINAAKLLEQYKLSGNFDNFIKNIEISLTEEVIHLITDEVATPQDLRNIVNELPEELANKIGVLYDKINTPEEGAAEYVRQVIQSKLFGTTTELEAYINNKDYNFIIERTINLFKKIVNYIKEAFQNNPTPEAKKVIDRIESYINQNINNNKVEKYKDVVRKERNKEQVKESIQIVNEINESKDYHAEAIKINDNSHYIELFEKEELPEEYKRINVDKNLTPQELGSEQLNKILWKMKKVFPDFSHQIINESRLQELLPNLSKEDLLKTNAFIIDKTVYLVEGKFTPEIVAEEFLHPFILSITQDEAKLNELFLEASKLYNLSNAFNQYSKIDENTAKREVITRALSFLVKEELTKEKESFLKKILNLIRKVFSKFNTTSTLQTLASSISNDDIQLDYLTTDQPQFNIGIDTKDLFERFKQNPIENGLRKEEIIVDGIKVEVYKNKFDKIVKRVSDIIKERSKKIFQNNSLDEAEAEKKALWEVQREKGSQIHKDIENLIRLFIDTKTGLKLQGDIDTSSFRPVATIIDSYKETYKNTLETYVRDLLDTYPSDTRFLLENLFVNTKAKNQLAGTIDFIAITPNGIDILDWKTIYSLKDGKIATYKKANWKEQLAQYKGILKQEFQLSDSDFRYARIIPILPQLTANPMKQDIEKISIGKVKTKEETNFNLLPFLSTSDALLKSGMGDFMTKLVALIEKQEQTESKRLGTNVKDYILQAELEEAVQSAVLQNNYSKVFNFIVHIEKKSKETVDEINNRLKDGIILNNEEVKYYSSLVRNLTETVSGLKGFFEYSEKELDEENKTKHANDIGKITKSILSFESHVKDINKAIVSNIGKKEGFINITDPEKVVTWWDANFKRFSRGPTKSVKLLQSVLRPVFSNITVQRKDAVLKGQSIGNKLMNWGQRNNKTQQEIFNMFITLDRNGKPILSEKKSVDFYKARTKAKESKVDAIQFIKDNYDLEAFNKRKEEYLKEQFAKIDGYFKTDEEKKALKLREKNNLDITIKPQYLLTNPMLNEFLKEELWYSDFFKTINEKGNEELLEFWNYITFIITRAKDTGISDDITNRFVPQRLKDIYETEAKKLWSKYIEGLKISPDQYEFGAINPITGLQEDRLYLNFTRDLGETIEGEPFKKDYSNVSTDLLRSFMAFEYDLIEKENIQAAEDFSEVLSDFEAANKIINVGKLGGILKYFSNGVTELSKVEQGKDGLNAKVYDGFKRMYIYNQQIQDYTDFAIKIGKDEYISGIKTIKKVVQTARSSAFALNVMSPLRNLILGKINGWINTTPHFSPSFSPSSNLHILDDIFINLDSVKDKKFVALLEFVLPLSTDNFQKELNKASLKSGIRKFSFDNLQILMKNSDDVVQIHIFKELLNNSTVRDGKIVNINTWVKEQHKKNNNYSEFYKLSLEDRNTYQKQINEEIQKLKKTDNIYNYVSVKDDVISVKGVDRNDESVAYLRNLNRQYAAEATGSLSQEDRSLSSTSFVMQMMSMYRSWIAPTVGVRAGKFDYLEQGVTEGRMRSMVKYLAEDTEKKSKKLKNLLMGATFGIFDKESLIQVAKDLRKKKINELKESGKYSKEVSEDEFVEMYLRNIDSAFKDLRATFTLFTLVSLGLASSLMGGGSDDDKKTNLQKIVEKELKKYNNELTFYYNPLEALSIIKNPFPVSTYIDNYLRLITNTVAEPFNPDKNHPLKYLLKSFPVTNMVATYLPIVDDETAKELGIKLTTNYGIR